MDDSSSLRREEAELVSDVAHQLVDIVRSATPFAEDPQHIGHFETGIPQFDSLTPDQQIVLIEQVLAMLLDPSKETPPRTAYRDAVIAAIYGYALTLIEVEIDSERISESAEDGDTDARRNVAAAYLADAQCDPALCPDPECAVTDHWDLVVNALRDRVLPDEDFLLGDLTMDLPPVAADGVKEEMGIHPEFFTAIPPDSTRQDARVAWAKLCQRTTGNRPALWRFDCETQHMVVLSDVTDAMGQCGDEWCAYLNIETAKVALFPSDLVGYIEENQQDNQDYFGDWPTEAIPEAREFFEDWDAVIEVPGKFEIHEWEIMRNFGESLSEGDVRVDLLKAIRGSGAFRYFKDTLDRHQLRDEWFQFRDQAFNRIAIDWLDQHDIPWEMPF